MTDPRILECAKAIYALHRVPKPEFAVWEALGGAARSHWVALATGCIQEWLSQTATIEMRRASGAHIATADVVYAAMCAQAARELK